MNKKQLKYKFHVSTTTTTWQTVKVFQVNHHITKKVKEKII